MYALILFGLIGALVMGARNQMNFADVMRWAFMPNVTHVQSTNVSELEPWATIFWKLTGSALLLVASAHGMHGLVVIADDYIASARSRQIVRLLSIVMLVAMSAIGLYVIWTSS
jgi:succinate dehydrogenase hydrophobic anchor subunit